MRKKRKWKMEKTVEWRTSWIRRYKRYFRIQLYKKKNLKDKRRSTFELR